MTAIKHRFTDETLCEFDVMTTRQAAEKGKANLREADLGEKFGKLKVNGFFSVGPLGSRNDTLLAFHTEKGVFVRAGCFFNSLDEFRAKVIETHGEESKHGKLYLGMANVIEFKFSSEARLAEAEKC